MRRAFLPFFCIALFPASAPAQEITPDEIIARIRATVGTEAITGAQPPAATRTFTMENGVDRNQLPQEVVVPPTPPSARPPLTPTTCHVVADFHTIEFGRGSARLANDQQTQKNLVALVSALTDPRVGNVPFIVRGHTDTTGSIQTNLRLSRERAQAVAKVLIDGGVHADRIQAAGMASTVPLNAANPGDGKNRRVDICT